MGRPCFSKRLYIKIAPSSIGRFRFLLEAHDNLALFTAVDKFQGVLLLRFSPDQEEEVRGFLERITPEIPVDEVYSPEFEQD